MTAPVLAGTGAAPTVRTDFANVLIPYTYGVGGTPSPIHAGELLLTFDGNSGDGVNDMSYVAETGWDIATDGTNQALVIDTATDLVAAATYLRIASGLESGTDEFGLATGSVSNRGHTGQMARIIGAHPTLPVHKVQVTTIDTSSPVAILGVTTEIPDCLVFYLMVGAGTSTRTTSWGSGTEQWDGGIGTTVDNFQSVATLVKASPGPTGTNNAMLSGAFTAAVGICIAIAPADNSGWGNLPI